MEPGLRRKLLWSLPWVLLAMLFVVWRATRPTWPLSFTHAHGIDVEDAWGGLGCPYDFFARLSARGASFEGEATLRLSSDPPLPARHVVIARDHIVRLEQATERARVAMRDSRLDEIENIRWSDDYPSGSITFSDFHSSTRLFFPDQHRVIHLQRGGVIEALDLPNRDRISEIWAAYRAVIDATGLETWVASACRERSPSGSR